MNLGTLFRPSAVDQHDSKEKAAAMRTDSHVDRATQAERPTPEDEALDIALDALDDIEKELREQAIGLQDGYLLDVANRMRNALSGYR